MTRTFQSLYFEIKKQPSPATQFVREVADITKRSEQSVRMWIAGKQTPDALVQQTLSQYFGVPAEKLFPTKK